MTDDAQGGRTNPSYKGLRPASEAASRSKRANRKTDTAHELLLRRALWRRGLRYRKHASDLPGRPDLVFRRARVVVFCDGDFWHGRDWEKLRAQLARRHNADYWLAKITRNRRRDADNTALLQRQGWRVIRLWETDVVANVEAAADAVSAAVAASRSGS
jgi:DNA mismatch endonuclease (patch repair protein)